MRDYLAWRLAFGVTTPSTNTVVQPEYDDKRPRGVTNHLGRMMISDTPVWLRISAHWSILSSTKRSSQPSSRW